MSGTAGDAQPGTGLPRTGLPETALPAVQDPPDAETQAERVARIRRVLPNGAPDHRPVLASVPRAVQVSAAWAWRLLVIVAGIVALAYLLDSTRTLWVPVVIAVLLAALLLPLHRLLIRRLRFPRGLAAITSVLLLIVFVGGLLTLAGRQIATGFGELGAQAADGFQELLDFVAGSGLGISSEMIDSWLTDATDQLSEDSDSILTGALSVGVTLGHVVVGTIVTLFALFFMLKDGRTIRIWTVRLFPRSARRSLHEGMRRGAVTLTSFVRTQILVALIDAIGIGVGAAILGLPLALPLGVLVFLGSFIPFVGAIATGSIAVLVALVALGPVQALIMLAIVLGVQQIESHLLQPLLLGHAVSLHPLAVLLSVAAGSMAAGIIGALLAVPLVATTNTVVQFLMGRDKFPELGVDTAVEFP